MMKTKIAENKYWILTLGFLVVVYGIAVIGTFRAKANPVAFAPSARTNNKASSTGQDFLTFGGMLGGVGTSTVTYDSYQNIQGSNSAVNTAGTKYAVANIQFTGSSTLSQLLVFQDDSQDGVDWYARNYASSTALTPIDLSQIVQYQLQAASTTATTIASSTDTVYRSYKIEVPERYTRLKFSVASSTNPGIRNGAIWAEIVPIKEVR